MYIKDGLRLQTVTHCIAFVVVGGAYICVSLNKGQAKAKVRLTTAHYCALIATSGQA